jgi:anti-sigma regulatory factor (Ser/Thr protein kinase)
MKTPVDVEDQVGDATGDRAHDGEVHLVVPPRSIYLRAVRLVAADAAGRAQLDCEETEDFRLAVDELCHAIMSATDHSVVVTVNVEDGAVVARGSARRRADAPPLKLNKLTERLLLALADTVSLDESADQVSFVVTKRRADRG